MHTRQQRPCHINPKRERGFRGRSPRSRFLILKKAFKAALEEDKDGEIDPDTVAAAQAAIDRWSASSST